MNEEERDGLERAELAALGRLAATPDGERFLLRFFYRANVLNGIHSKNADVYRLSGIQAFGIDFWNELWRANPAASTQIYARLMRLGNPYEEENDE